MREKIVEFLLRVYLYNPSKFVEEEKEVCRGR